MCTNGLLTLFLTDQLNVSLSSPVLSVSPAVPSTYYIRVGSNGCFLEDSVSVSLFEGQIQLDTFMEICFGDSGQILATVLSSDSLTYNWSPAMDILSGNGTPLIWVNPNATTVFTLTATNKCWLCHYKIYSSKSFSFAFVAFWCYC